MERAAHDETAEKMVQLQQRLEVTLQVSSSCAWECTPPLRVLLAAPRGIHCCTPPLVSLLVTWLLELANVEHFSMCAHVHVYICRNLPIWSASLRGNSVSTGRPSSQAT